MKTVSIPLSIIQGNLTSYQLREFNNKFNITPKYTYEDILKQRYYHADAPNPCICGSSVEIGTHGPEIRNGKLYISIYHYLEYINKNPNEYDTLILGKHLTSESWLLPSSVTIKFIECKYKKQDYRIHKYELEFLKKEDKLGTFEKFLSNRNYRR